MNGSCYVCERERFKEPYKTMLKALGVIMKDRR